MPQMQPFSFVPRRPIAQALVVSLLVHAGLLYGVHGLYPVGFDQPVAMISAVLRQLPSKASTVQSATQTIRPVAPSTVRPATAKPPPRPPRSLPERERSADLRQKQIADVSAALDPVTSVAPSSAVMQYAAPAEAAPAGASGPVVSPAATPGGEASAAVSDRVNAVAVDDVRQYRIALASAARQFRTYPALARERGWEGTAEIAVSLSSSWPGPKVTLFRSSGRNLLDEQAVAMMAQAARATRLPEGLMHRDVPSIVLPVVFSLDNDQ